MKVAKILGVVFGALFLLTGIGLFAAAEGNTGGSGVDRQLAERGLTGPIEGRVTGIEGPIYTVEYTDQQGTARAGRGVVAEGTTPPAQGDDVQVYYSTADPAQIIILDFPGGSFAGVAGLLRTIGIVCLVIGAVLLLAGLLGLVIGRKRSPAVTAGQAGYAPPAAVQAAQAGPSDPTQAPPPDAAQAYPPQPASTPTEPPGADVGGQPGQPSGPGTPQDPPPPAAHNRPGG